MSLRGLWRWAEADPDRIALIEVSGRETSMAELAGDANRVVHALRKLGPFQVRRGRLHVQAAARAGLQACGPARLRGQMWWWQHGMGWEWRSMEAPGDGCVVSL